MPQAKKQETKIHEGLTKGQKRSLNAVAKDFAAAWAAVAKSDIHARYALGIKIHETKSKYGSEGVKGLAQAINRSAAFVYSYAAVTELWTPKELRSLQAQQGGGRIEWSHLVLLSNKKIVDPKRRAQLVSQIVGERISPTQLKKIIYPKTTSEVGDDELLDHGAVDDVGSGAATELDAVVKPEAAEPATSNSEQPTKSRRPQTMVRQNAPSADPATAAAVTSSTPHEHFVRPLREFNAAVSTVCGYSGVLAGIVKQAQQLPASEVPDELIVGLNASLASLEQLNRELPALIIKAGTATEGLKLKANGVAPVDPNVSSQTYVAPSISGVMINP